MFATCHQVTHESLLGGRRLYSVFQDCLESLRNLLFVRIYGPSVRIGLAKGQNPGWSWIVERAAVEPSTLIDDDVQDQFHFVGRSSLHCILQHFFLLCDPSSTDEKRLGRCC